MSIPNQKVQVVWNQSNKKHYEQKGYNFTSYKETFFVDVCDLTKAYSKEIAIVCDYCNEEFKRNFRKVDLLKKHSCKKCNHGKSIKSKAKKAKVFKHSTVIMTRCKICGEETPKKKYEFKGHGEHFCSRKCMGKYRFTVNNPNPKKDKISVKCFQCGEITEEFPSVVKKNKWHFCTRDCYGKFRSEQLIGENNPSYQGLIKKCDQCGEDILVIQSKLVRNKNVFCSTECYGEYRSIHYSGVNHNQYGIKKSPEQIEKMRISTAKRIANGQIPTTSTKINVTIREVLKERNIQFEEEKQFKYYTVDFYLPDSNKVIEVMGDYWHANPMKYVNYDELNEIQKKDIIRDKRKRTYLEKHHDIKILYIWEQEVNQDLDLCRELIKVFSSTSNLDDYNSFNYLYLKPIGLILKDRCIKPYFDRDPRRFL